VCIALCTTVAHNIAQNRPDSFPPYPPDNHHCSDDVYLREGGCHGWQQLLCKYHLKIVHTVDFDAWLHKDLVGDADITPSLHKAAGIITLCIC